jgi:PEP-CTERM motif-containing protein
MGKKLTILTVGMLAVLFLSANAKADTFLYDFSVPNGFGNVGGVVNIQFTEATLAPSGDVTSFLSATDPSGVVTDFLWNSAAGAFCGNVAISGFGCAEYRIPSGFAAFAFAAGSFLSPGTYTDAFTAGATLTITDISAVPEPSSLLLLATGLLGLGLATRLRFRAA